MHLVAVRGYLQLDGDLQQKGSHFCTACIPTQMPTDERRSSPVCIGSARGRATPADDWPRAPSATGAQSLVGLLGLGAGTPCPCLPLFAYNYHVSVPRSANQGLLLPKSSLLLMSTPCDHFPRQLFFESNFVPELNCHTNIDHVGRICFNRHLAAGRILPGHRYKTDQLSRRLGHAVPVLVHLPHRAPVASAPRAPAAALLPSRPPRRRCPVPKTALRGAASGSGRRPVRAPRHRRARVRAGPAPGPHHGRVAEAEAREQRDLRRRIPARPGHRALDGPARRQRRRGQGISRLGPGRGLLRRPRLRAQSRPEGARQRHGPRRRPHPRHGHATQGPGRLPGPQVPPGAAGRYQPRDQEARGTVRDCYFPVFGTQYVFAESSDED
ncbi:hypothetical protein B0T26DRAFT_725577 [Lasiosphaeria miniovina]|uniref:Uncharacterized protein n=1 Tax=Lasiosphaeria miniovina TaxID=1954250 RepID=A0AA40DJQ7_9PEZI|nr:uncharacterized protein B0T26DRAFT_725577 [Lasiosphaeria miniovina]KAK0706144.1 hypothetical protein B0T26DRAFT_725577 [Lasiosphaeria miniovina]